MDKWHTSIFALLIILPLVPFAFAFADELTEQYNYTPHVLAGLSFIVAGLWYSCAGWIKKVRRAADNNNLRSLDFVKMAKSVVVGIVLGVGAFILSIFQGEALAVHNMHEFLIQVGLNTAVIMAVDKIILGTADKPPAAQTRAVPPGH